MDNQAKGRANRKIILLAAIIYLLMVSVSVYVFVLKRDALRFHSRDYNYFIEQAARLADPELSNTFALNVNGYNFLGLQGIEGVKGVYHAIHAEWFRYSYVVLYWLFHSTLAIYFCYSLVFFAPVLYFAFLQPRQSRDAWQRVILFTLLFALFPAVINTVTFDLRPRALFVSAWSLAILAVYYRRPLLEKLIFFGLLLGIREEGILLGLVVVAFNFLRMQGKPRKWQQTILFLFLAAAAFAAFLAFMAWGEYNRYGESVNPFIFLNRLLTSYPVPILIVGLLVAGLIAYFWFSKRDQFSNLMLLLVYSGAILLTGFQFLRFLKSEGMTLDLFSQGLSLAGYLRVITGRELALLYYVTLVFLFILWEFTRNFSYRLLQWIFILLGLVFMVTTIHYVPPQLLTWSQKAVSARLVWDFKNGHNRYLTNVLVDETTYQAFYDYENTIVYNRLPISIVGSENRYYPANKPFVVNLIKQRMEYAVISQDSLKNVLEMAGEAGIPAAVVASNDGYVVLKLSRPLINSPLPVGRRVDYQSTQYHTCVERRVWYRGDSHQIG